MRELGMDTKEQIEQLKLAADILQEGCAWEVWHVSDQIWGPPDPESRIARYLANPTYKIRKAEKPDPFAAIKTGILAGKKYEVVDMGGKWSEWVGGLDFGLRKAAEFREMTPPLSASEIDKLRL